MKLHLIVGAMLLPLAAGCGKPKNGPDLARVDKNAEATYEVVILPQGHGSGFVVHESGYMLTNHHVCGNGDRELRITVSENGAKPQRFKATVVGFDADQDICAVKVEHTFSNPVILGAMKDVHLGDDIYNIGFPYSFGKLVNRGSVAKKAWDETKIGVRNGLMVDMEFAHPGSSGSGVYLVRSGKLVGMIKMLAWRQAVRGFTRLPPMTVKICVGVDDIKAFLDKYNVPYHTDRKGDREWSVPVDGQMPQGHQIEIIQVEASSAINP